MKTLTAARAWFNRRVVSLAVSLALAVAALLGLGGWVARAAAPEAPSGVAFAVLTTVDSPDSDLNDGACHDVVDGVCSLRAAVQQLSHDSGGLIALPIGTYNLTDDADGDLQFQKDIQLYGGGPGISVIQGSPSGWNHRILRVQSGAVVLLSGVTISGGSVPNLVGGGIYVASGVVTLTNVLVAHNTAGYGGGVYNSGQLEVDNSTIRANQAISDGGGIYNGPSSLQPAAGAAMTVSLSTIANNSADQGGGGGAYNTSSLRILKTTVDQNTALGGGGLSNAQSGLLRISGSTLSHNHATDGYGGGLANLSSAAATTLVNSTVAFNRTIYHGGGLADVLGTIDLSNVTVAQNQATGTGTGGGIYAVSGQTFTLRNTLIGFNEDPQFTAPDCGGTFQSDGHNMIAYMLGCTLVGGTGDIENNDQRFFDLGDFGGPTLTYALKLDSPAVDKGNSNGCKDSNGSTLVNDQRGMPRTFDGDQNGNARCDIGAYELNVAPIVWLPLVKR